MLDGEADVGGAHESFADEDGVDAGGFQAEEVGVGADAALADEGDAGGDLVADPEGQVEVGDEAGEVAVVDADEGGAGVEDTGEVGLVVELDEGLRMQFEIDDWQRLGLGSGQRIAVRLPGKDDVWLFVTGVTELPPIVWVTMARRVRAAG